MRGIGLARGRALAACAAAALAALLSGCTAPASTVSVSGTKLTIYASVPSALTGDSRVQDVLAAEHLAFQNNPHTIGKFSVGFVVLHGAKPSDNARTVIQDSTAVAYLGEISPGQSEQSLGILNAEDVLTVSPTDTAVELTQSTPAVAGAPGAYYESLGSYGRTFARLVPTTALEAKALLAEAQQLGVSKLYLAGDGTSYSAALQAALRSAAASGVSVVSGPATAAGFASSGASALLYTGADIGAAARLCNGIATANPGVSFLGSSALATQQFVANLTPTAQKTVYISSPGSMPSQLPASFTSAFRAATGHAPSPEAYFGYQAMQQVLQVLRQAGSKANDRGTVVRDFIPATGRSQPQGIDANGDTNITSFVISRASSGVLTPYRAVQG